MQSYVFFAHHWCVPAVKPGIKLSTTSYGAHCAVCGALDENNRVEFVLDAVLLREEECDCDGVIRHMNGGNPHFAEWEALGEPLNIG